MFRKLYVRVSFANPGEMKRWKGLHTKTIPNLTNDRSQPPFPCLPSALTGIFKIPLQLRNRLFEKPAVTFRVINGAKRHAGRYVVKRENQPTPYICLSAQRLTP